MSHTVHTRPPSMLARIPRLCATSRWQRTLLACQRPSKPRCFAVEAPARAESGLPVAVLRVVRGERSIASPTAFRLSVTAPSGQSAEIEVFGRDPLAQVGLQMAKALGGDVEMIRFKEQQQLSEQRHGDGNDSSGTVARLFGSAWTIQAWPPAGKTPLWEIPLNGGARLDLPGRSVGSLVVSYGYLAAGAAVALLLGWLAWHALCIVFASVCDLIRR